MEKDLKEVMRSFAKLRNEHTHDRDKHNNYGCFNVVNCKNCNYVYNARDCIGCHNCDGMIDCVQCVDCSNCAYCVGLQGAKFHFLNVEYTELEYYNKLRLYGVDWEVDEFAETEEDDGKKK